MKLFKAVIVSDGCAENEVDVEASSLRVAFTKAARHCRMSQWARIKITFVRNIEFAWVLIFEEPDVKNPKWTHWVEHREHGSFKSLAVAMQHACTVLGIETGSIQFTKVSARRVRV